MSEFLCVRTQPHRHDWPAEQPDGGNLVFGDVARCSCGMYARWSAGDFNSHWRYISERRAKRLIRKYCP